MTHEIEDDAPEMAPVPSTALKGYSDSMDSAVHFAQLMAKARSVLPGHLQNKPGECLAIVMLARDWNMNPYSVGMKTSIINNRLMFEGQLVNAIINNSRALAERLRYEFEGEGANRKCTATGRIRNEPETREVTVGMPGPGEATNSPLWKGSQEQKDQQLTYKAARVWARRHVPEVLLGVYTPEDDWKDVQADTTDKGAIQNRVMALETAPANVIDVPQGGDDFVDKPAPIYIQKDGTTMQGNTAIGGPGQERQISTNPEDRKPQYKCATCEDTQVVEETDLSGKVRKLPCYICNPNPLDAG